MAATTIELDEESEVALELVARSTGASWARRGAEAAAVTICVDNAYHSDLLLWAGDEAFTYHVLLGRLPRGRHSVSVRANPARSARDARGVEVASLRTTRLSVPRGMSVNETDAWARAYAPVLYARANSIDRFTDVPLVMYYETEWTRERNLRLRYTVIFSNEDGGTPPAALMARWGRATDIEWVYEVELRDGRIVDERYQGVEHETKPFTGSRTNGEHPLLAVASDNNNFSDLACSAVRWALVPIRAQLDSASRERVMDDAPWMYRIMAEELARERRINDSPSDANTIADPRRYLYLEAYAEQTGTALSFDAGVREVRENFSSDMGDARLRVERNGYFRVAVRLDARTALSSVTSVTVRCHTTTEPTDERFARSVRLMKVFMLDSNYVPRELRIEERSPVMLRPGEAGIFRLVL